MRSGILFVGLMLSFACGETGVRWTAIELTNTERPRTLHGTAANDVYLAGDKGLVKHFDGNAWKVVNMATTSDFKSVAAFSASSVWLLGFLGEVYEGNATSGFTKKFEASNKLQGNVMFPVSATEVYFYLNPLEYSVTSSDQDNYWYDGSGFRLMSFPDGDSDGIQSVSGNSQAGVWMVRNYKLYRGSQGKFQQVNVPFDTSWYSVVARAADDVWLWGSSTCLHFDGKTWTTVETEVKAPKTGIGFSATRIWFGGDYGRLSQWDGTTLKVEAGDETSGLYVVSMWGASEKDLWAVASYSYNSNSFVLRRFEGP